MAITYDVFVSSSTINRPLRHVALPYYLRMASNDMCNVRSSKSCFHQVNLGETEAYTVEEVSHSQDVLNGLYQHFRDERFCDVTLVFGQKEIKAHKVVLTSFSQYFEAMFSDNFVDVTQQRLEINGIGESVGEALIEFAYTGKIQITSENVIEILAGANFLQGFQVVEKSCADFLKKYSGKHNLFQILEVADHFHQNDLKKTLKEFCIQNVVDCIESDHKAFLNLDEDLLKDLISSEELVVFKDGVVFLGKKQEEYLLTQVLEYLEHNKKQEIKIADILKCIHLPLLKKPFLHALKTNPLLDSKECLAVLEEAITMKKSKKNEEKPKPDWAKRRACGEYQFWKGRCIAAGGQVDNEIETFEDIVTNEDDYVSGMKIWIRRWDGRPVVGGIEVQYSDGRKIMHGSNKGAEKDEFGLEPNERIIKIDSQSGWMIDSLTFYTSKDRKLGPYGGPGGGFRHETPDGSYGYLIGINGSVVDTQSDLGITKLQFVWRIFRGPNQSSIPDFQNPVGLFDNSFDEDDIYDDYLENDYYDDFYDVEDENDYDSDIDNYPDDWEGGAEGYDEFYDYDDNWPVTVHVDDWETLVGAHEPRADNLDKEVD